MKRHTLLGVLASIVSCVAAQATPISGVTAAGPGAVSAALPKIVVSMPEGPSLPILAVDLAFTFLVVFLIRRRVLQAQR